MNTTPQPAGAGGSSAGRPNATLASEVMDHPFLNGFSPDQVEQLIRCAKLRDLEAGDLIFKQGDPAHSFYLIVWGAVSLTHAGLKGNTAIQTLTAGDAVGWSWLFPPYAWHFNAMATEGSRVIEFDGERIQELCHAEPQFGFEFMNRIAQVVIERLQHARRKLFKITGGA